MPLVWAIVGMGVVSAWLYKVSKGPSWRGFSAEIFGKDEFEGEDDV